MSNLTWLEKKYKELGEEIDRLKSNQIGYKDDPIFLLSEEEVEKFKDKIISEENNYWFWTRSASASFADDSNIAWLVYGYYGIVDINSVDRNFAARPALDIDLIGLSVNKNKDKIVYCGVTWIRLNNNIFISEVPIGWSIFDKNNNEYENSEIRQYLLNWYEVRKGWGYMEVD